MKINRSLALFAVVAIAACVAGCGRQRGVAPAGATPAAATQTSGLVPHAAVASQLGSYREIDFGKKINERDWADYRRVFVSSAAALPDVTDPELAALADEAIGREGDAFKRDDLVKAAQAQVDHIRQQANAHIEMVDSSEDFATLIMVISKYDIASETYQIRPISVFDGEGIGFTWMKPSGGRSQLMYSLSAKDFREVTKKVPKDVARTIEARIAPLRTPGQDWVRLPARLYATVTKADKKDWNDAELIVNVDAIALTLPKHGDETLILVDGPDVQHP